jgi:hypothetical protein
MRSLHRKIRSASQTWLAWNAIKQCLIVSMAMVCLTFNPQRLSAQAPAGLLIQVQAADVMSDLITYTTVRTDARVASMNEYLGQIGKEGDYANSQPIVQPKKSLAYDQVFKGAVLFVQNGGSKYADPSLSSLSESSLYEKLTEIQMYNIQQFMHLRQQRQACNSLQAYLTSTGQMDNYLKWSGTSAPATQAAAVTPPTNPQEVAAQMDQRIKLIQDIAWKKAKARGESRADFDQAWAQHVAQFKESVAAKVDGMKALAQSLTQPPPPAPTPTVPNAVIWHVQGPPPVAAPNLPPPVESRDTDAMYQAKDAQLDTEWGNNAW